MSVPLAIEGMDALALAQEGERLCRESNFRAGITYLQMALDKKIDIGGRSLEAVSAVYSQMGNAYFALRDFQKALKYHQLDLETAQILNDRSGLAKAHGNIGNTYKALGNFDLAYEHSSSHLQLARELGDRECEARALYNMGSIFHCEAKTYIRTSPVIDESGLLVAPDPNATKQLRNAIKCYLQNLEIVEDMKDLAACGRTYGNIGNSYYLLGEHSTAVTYHNKRLEIARQFGDRPAMKRAYTNLGNAHIFLSQLGKALEYYRLALSMAVELHDEMSEAQCCLNVGNGAALSGEQATAIEFHTRYLKLTRKLNDERGEAHACCVLGADYKSSSETNKAAYFFVLSYHIYLKLRDFMSGISARRSLEDLLSPEGKWPINGFDEGLIHLDSSADPDPRPEAVLSESLHDLFSTGKRDESQISKETTSTAAMCDDRDIRVGSTEEDFFDMVTRLQSKRIDDQRCDPVIFTDLTNRSKGLTRQSDTAVCNTGTNLNSANRSHRLSSIFGRVGKAARHSFLLSSFRPSSSSTPRSRISSTCYASGAASSMVPSLNFQEDETFDIYKGQLKNEEADSTNSVSSLFRVPALISRKRGGQRSLSSFTSFRSLRTRSLSDEKGAEGMLDLIASLQGNGRRMEEQRAHLIATRETSSLTGTSHNEDSNDSEQGAATRRLERSRSEDAGSLYELVIRGQGDRIEEQRSELPSVAPDDDISEIVMTMQKGRIHGQRAQLNSPSQN